MKRTLFLRQNRGAPIIGDDAIRCRWSDSHKCLVGIQSVKEEKEANKREQAKKELKEKRNEALDVEKDTLTVKL